MDSQRQALPIRRLMAAFLYAGTAIVSLVLGAIYLFRASFMPYHAVAFGKDWRELDHATQTLLKGLMEVAAAGGWHSESWSCSSLRFRFGAASAGRGLRRRPLAAPTRILESHCTSRASPRLEALEFWSYT